MPGNVLFVAMSGVRVKSHELAKLGVTLPGFVERSKVIASLPSLSLLTVAAHTPPGWRVAYEEIDERDDIDATGFDIVAISSFTARILDAYALAAKLRARGKTVVLGGLHVSAMPDEAEAHADAIVQGEAEIVWPELLADYEAGRLRKRYSSFGRDLPAGDLPVPRYDLLDIEKYNRLTLQTTRGCPHHCTFCAASRTISRYRKKPLAQVERELNALLERWPRAFVELADDNTFVDKEWSKGLVRLLAKHPIKWFTETDISVAEDVELLDLLADSGCAQVLVGLEAAHPGGLATVDIRDWKRRQYDDYLAKIDRIQSRGVSVNGCFILGHDEDDETVFERTRDFIRESKLTEAQVTLLTPFPGTLLYDRLKREGRLKKEVFWDECTLFDVTFVPKRLSASALETGFRWLMKEVYSDEETKRRKRLFRNLRKERHREKRLA